MNKTNEYEQRTIITIVVGLVILSRGKKVFIKFIKYLTLETQSITSVRIHSMAELVWRVMLNLSKCEADSTKKRYAVASSSKMQFNKNKYNKIFLR